MTTLRILVFFRKTCDFIWFERTKYEIDNSMLNGTNEIDDQHVLGINDWVSWGDNFGRDVFKSN